MRIARDDLSFSMPTAYSAGGTNFSNGRSVSLVGRIQAMFAWVSDLPRRRAVIDELSALSDHELADIGLVRGELHRVFDRSFTGRRAA